MKPAVLIGSSGQVSRALAAALEDREIIATSSSGRGNIRLDLSDPSSIREAFVEIGERTPNGAEVFLAGAMTHVDRCEQERDQCARINAHGPALVAELSHERGYGLTYFSTEYVFGNAEYEGGPVGPFAEEDPPAPTSWYGQCKLDAERAVQKIYGPKGALIVRTTMVYSWDPTGMNFLMQYLRQLEEGTNPFRIPVDQISTPTYAPALAEATISLRSQGVGGVINLVGPDLLSRGELVEKVAAAFGYPPARVKEAFRFVNTADLGQAARRPLTAGLKIERARARGVPLPGLAEAFAEIKRLRGGVERER